MQQLCCCTLEGIDRSLECNHQISLLWKQFSDFAALQPIYPKERSTSCSSILVFILSNLALFSMVIPVPGIITWHSYSVNDDRDRSKPGQRCNHATRFLVEAASRVCLANLSWAILGLWPNHRNWYISFQRWKWLDIQALRISQLRTLCWSVTRWTLRKNSIYVAYTWDSTLSDITQDSWLKVKSEQTHIYKLTVLRCLKAPVL